MSRPLYETKQDLINENEMKSVLEAKWSCVLNKLPIKYNLEWLAMRGKVPMAFIEFKHREKLSIKSWSRYMMSLDKWIRAQQLSKEMKIPFIMVVTFMEGTYYGIFPHDDSHDVRYMFGGRFDRGDAQDVEPMVLLPLKFFKKLI
jgi:hypothetical protein